MIRLIRMVILVAVLMVGVSLAGCSSEGPPAPGKAAPDFQLQTLDGKTVTLSELRGSPVVINFWAIRCFPCRYEMPFLQELYEDREWAKRRLVILAVNLGEPSSLVQKFMEENGLFFTVLLDSKGKIGMLYNVQYIPTTYFVDNDGIIRNIKIGAFRSKSDIDRVLMNMLMSDES